MPKQFKVVGLCGSWKRFLSFISGPGGFVCNYEYLKFKLMHSSLFADCNSSCILFLKKNTTTWVFLTASSHGFVIAGESVHCGMVESQG